MLDQIVSPATALIDSPAAEQEQADQRAALAGDTFDPCGLYRLEQERDEAFDELCRALPEHASVTVEYARPARQFIGRAQPVQTRWMVTVSAEGHSANAHGDTSTAAVAEALREFRAAEMTGRVAVPA